MYIGWTEDGEWTNYTVDVKKSGTYRIIAMYSNTAQAIQFSLNNKPAADCNLPLNPAKKLALQNYPDWIVWHIWNKADCGEIHFPQAGRQLLTLHYKQGNNLAYFDFVPIAETSAHVRPILEQPAGLAVSPGLPELTVRSRMREFTSTRKEAL